MFSGAVMERYGYDPYGMPLIRENFGRGGMFNENRTGGDNRPQLLLAVGGSIGAPRGEWKQHLRRPEDDAELGRLRRSLHTGRPLASDGWLSKLEARMGVRLRADPIGRPRKRTMREKK